MVWSFLGTWHGKENKMEQELYVKKELQTKQLKLEGLPL